MSDALVEIRVGDAEISLHTYTGGGGVPMLQLNVKEAYGGDVAYLQATPERMVAILELIRLEALLVREPLG